MTKNGESERAVELKEFLISQGAPVDVTVTDEAADRCWKQILNWLDNQHEQIYLGEKI